jgi:hypothetical protein
MFNLRLLLILSLIFLMPSSGNAYSLGGLPTDDSVCDLAPNTSSKLSRGTFVDAGTRNEDSIYERLALRKVVENCANGQTLILHAKFGTRLEDAYFSSVAARVCAAAGVTRESRATTDYPNAFQTKCTIQKLDQARAWLTAAEQRISTEQMILDGAPKRSANTPPANAEVKKDCSKLNLSTLVNGGGAGCNQ